ncbi:hypothetical protein WIS52_24265 [Pseudonocardia nematodicida]|uniref:Uncharacterized protein n=1 Tax=Pseudonocardia nematodicida TaxID=1206997 RepID=A0ABV1KGL3_9PSEU
MAEQMLSRGGRVVPDSLAVDVLLVREQARHHSEWRATRDEFQGLTDSPPGTLISRIEEDLATVSAAAIRALAAVREARSRPDGVEREDDAVGPWLASAANSLRSALSAHLALEARHRLRPGQED